MLTVHLLIKGKVQGVFFRATAQEKAEQFNVTGWVRNTNDGDVEAIATGEAGDVQKFIDWCHEGPANAQVANVRVEEKDPQIFEKFAILR